MTPHDVMLVLLFAVCGTFIVWPGYQDGLVGKLLLGAVCLGVLLRVGPVIFDGVRWDDYESWDMLILSGVTGFMMRHLWRRRWRFTRTPPRRRQTDRRPAARAAP